uniref:CHK domain-containing protein n=1 Tax=Glossina austeni TaxID=7395 RepID=A0A1A9VBG5_GLOAU
MTQQANDIPKWIEDELFEEVFRQTQPKYQSTRNFRISHALAPGENYTTIILKVEAEVLLKDGLTDDLSYMLKIGHSNENLPKDMKKFDAFDVENGMYKEIVPEFERMYAKVGRKIRFAAKSYTLATQEEHVLLEDLRRYGFKNVRRQDCLDLEHLKNALEKLAQWHAASAVMVQQSGLFDMKYRRGMLNEDGKELLQNVFDDTGRYVLKNITKLEGHEEYYDEVVKSNYLLEKIYQLFILLVFQRTFFSKFTDIFFENAQVDPEEFNVLNHGDYWSNNIMFQYAPDGSIKSTLPVDFQGPRYGSPAQDLLYLIFSSARLDIKISKFDYFIRFYHQKLIENLIVLNYSQPLPTLRELHQMLIKYGLWAMVPIAVTLPIILCQPSDKASLDNLIGHTDNSEEFKNLLYSNTLYLNHLKLTLPWLLYRGALSY